MSALRLWLRCSTSLWYAARPSSSQRARTRTPSRMARSFLMFSWRCAAPCLSQSGWHTPGASSLPSQQSARSKSRSACQQSPLSDNDDDGGARASEHLARTTDVIVHHGRRDEAPDVASVAAPEAAIRAGRGAGLVGAVGAVAVVIVHLLDVDALGVIMAAELRP